MTLPQRVVLILLALSLIAGIATGGQLYYRLSYFWGLLFFGSWVWSWFALRGVRVERSARTLRAQVGQVFEERFEIINDSRLFRLWLEVRNESALPESGGSQVLTLMGGRQRRIYWSQTLLTHRGVFPLGPTVLASGDLFGLFPVSRSIPAHDTLLVYPMMADIRAFPNPAGLLPGGEALRRRTHQVTPNASGVREYAPGDPLNRIHWQSTARRNRLIVKEFELDPLAEIWIFLDAERFGQASLPYTPQQFNVLHYWRQQTKVSLPPSTEEYSVSIAASLARHFIRRGRAVGLVSAGRHQTLLSPDRGGRQLGKILEALSLSRAEGELPLRAMVETQAKHIPRGSTVILISPTVQAEFGFVVEYLLRRGVRPLAVLLDTASFGGLSGSGMLAEKVRAIGVPVRLIECGANLEAALTEGYREKLKV
ncbi:MAG: DUF58 domain-containing protein [Chloroflexota bacterium]|nr:MAG: DUF58 domain-containing protein [Chloroflexota bacterium]